VFVERGLRSVTADDVALIEHVRQLRTVEASLSSAISDKARATIVEHIERCRWFHREHEIEEYVKRAFRRSAPRLSGTHYTNKKLSYRRGTARCVVSVEILPIAIRNSAETTLRQVQNQVSAVAN